MSPNYPTVPKGDFERRCAEALAEKFTRPTPRMSEGLEADGWIDPLPADRVGLSMSVEFVGLGGYQAFRAATCAEAAAVCAAVRDEGAGGVPSPVRAALNDLTPAPVSYGHRMYDDCMTLERLTINLIPKAAKALSRLVASNEDNKTNIINQALQMYDYLDEARRAGRQLLMRDPKTGETMEIVWF